MERLITTVLFSIMLLAPVTSQAVEVKSLKPLATVMSDDKETGLRLPQGIACGANGQFVVGDTGNARLLRYGLNGEKLTGGTPIKVAQVQYPVRLQLSSKGEILVLDGKQQRIVRLNGEGAFVAYLDPQGVPAPAKVSTQSFKLDSHDNVYLVDLAGERVLVLDASGKFVRQVPFPAGGKFFSDLTVGPNGEIFLLDAVDAVVYVNLKGGGAFSQLTKGLREYTSFPSYITTDNRGLLYLVDEHGDAVVVLGYDGSFVARKLSFGWKEGQLNYPQQICLSGDGNTLFITDRDNNRVQVFEVMK